MLPSVGLLVGGVATDCAPPGAVSLAGHVLGYGRIQSCGKGVRHGLGYFQTSFIPTLKYLILGERFVLPYLMHLHSFSRLGDHSAQITSSAYRLDVMRLYVVTHIALVATLVMAVGAEPATARDVSAHLTGYHGVQHCKGR